MDDHITWDWGTAYDFFCSLRVLHEPGHYGLRPSWAAGVRSRIPVEHREILEQVHRFLFIPKKWIFELPRPKDSDAVLWVLSRIPAEDRLLHLIEGSGFSPAVVDILRGVSRQGDFTTDYQEILREAYLAEKTKPRAKDLEAILSLVSHAGDSGEGYLAALRTYRRVFFRDEEKRIRSTLDDVVAEAQDLALKMSPEDLIEKLSRGVRIEVEPSIKKWTFVPSYWISPLVSFERFADDTAFFIFGGRPVDVSLVPGEVVPEGLLRSFKAMGDPTRLKILKYLSQENITPAEIARRLRLRAPTVTYHLNVLRLAGLVNLTLQEGNERFYASRMEAIEETFSVLDDFLSGID